MIRGAASGQKALMSGIEKTKDDEKGADRGARGVVQCSRAMSMDILDFCSRVLVIQAR
jgi:hypothetical protein